MNTVDFLRKILPQEGLYYVMLLRRDKHGGEHKAFRDIEDMAAYIKDIDENEPDATVYHSNSSYKNEFVLGTQENREKKYYRVASNQLHLRSFWIDIDTGEGREFDKDGNRKGYLKKKEASDGLVEFCNATGMPLPTVIDSGNGLHCYWTLTEDILPSEWLEVAPVFAACLAHTELHVDTSCTTDSRRILRPVGTHNRKPGKDERAVKLMKLADDIRYDDFKSIVDTYAEQHDLHVVPKEVRNNLNSDLTSLTALNIPSWGETIAHKCAQVAQMRDTQGDVSYEHWRSVIGVLKHCEDKEIAVEWTSKRHLSHSKTDVAFEMSTWNAGPARCAHFESHNPSGCEGCPHQGNIKSPIVLGYRELVSQEVEEEVVINGVAAVTVIPAFPKGFSYINGTMCKSIEIEDKIEVCAFSHTLFYAIRRGRKEDDKCSVVVRVHLPRDGVKDFQIDQYVISSKRDLLGALAANHIHTTNHRNAEGSMQSYLKDWIHKLMVETDELKTYTQFGWNDNNTSFLHGDRLFTPDGQVTEVLLGNMCKSELPAFKLPAGRLEAWSNAIDEMYNKPNEEHRQYAMISSFGSVLTPFSNEENYNGLLFAITGAKSSKGKTTVSRAAITAWGDPTALSIGTKRGATINALFAKLGVYNNTPVLLDEFTKLEADELSDLCYSVSAGVDRKRMTSSPTKGLGFAKAPSWKLVPFITANKDLHALLGSRGGDSEAEAVRMIQIQIDDYIMADREKIRFQELVRTAHENPVIAGETFIRYVVAHPHEVKALTAKWNARAVQDVPDGKFRFYRGHLECAMAALEICVKLGIFSFDVENVYKYAINLFIRLALDVKEQNSSNPEDMISNMINGLSHGIGVTHYYTETKSKSLVDGDNIRYIKDWTGRLITGVKGEGDPLAGKLFLSIKAVRDWCLNNRVTYNDIIREINSLGISGGGCDKRFVLGRGTVKPSGQTNCISIDFFKFESLYGTEKVPGVNKNIDATPEQEAPPPPKVSRPKSTNGRLRMER